MAFADAQRAGEHPLGPLILGKDVTPRQWDLRPCKNDSVLDVSGCRSSQQKLVGTG